MEQTLAEFVVGLRKNLAGWRVDLATANTADFQGLKEEIHQWIEAGEKLIAKTENSGVS